MPQDDEEKKSKELTIVELNRKIEDMRKDIEDIDKLLKDKKRSRVDNDIIEMLDGRKTTIVDAIKFGMAAMNYYNKKKAGLHDTAAAIESAAQLFTGQQNPTQTNEKISRIMGKEILLVEFKLQAKRLESYSFSKDGKIITHTIVINEDDIMGDKSISKGIAGAASIADRYQYDSMSIDCNERKIFSIFKNILPKPEKK